MERRAPRPSGAQSMFTRLQESDFGWRSASALRLRAKSSTALAAEVANPRGHRNVKMLSGDCPGAYYLRLDESVGGVTGRRSGTIAPFEGSAAAVARVKTSR